MTKTEVIYKLTSQIPAGKVVTYADIARAAKTSPRVVGNALHKNPNPAEIPCHRIINSKGQLAEHFAFGGAAGQAQKLSAEGVKVANNRVELARYLFTFKD